MSPSAQAKDRDLDRLGDAEFFQHLARDDLLAGYHPVLRIDFHQFREFIGAGEQVEAPDFMHDRSEHRGIGIDACQFQRERMGEGGHVCRVFPQLLRLGAYCLVDDLAAELADDHCDNQGMQRVVNPSA